MRLKDDFLTRMMEQMAQTIVGILKLKDRGQTSAAIRELDQSYQDFLGSSRAMLHKLSSEELLELISVVGVIDTKKALSMGQLLHLDAVLEPQGAEVKQLKALDLILEALQLEEDMLPEFRTKADELIEALSDFQLPLATQQRLFEYYAQTDNYAEAEDMLFELLDTEKDHLLWERGQRFYRALLEQDDDKLIQGGLPRAEVKEGLKALEGMVF